MLQARLRQHGSQVWLVNTGWSGGPTGQGTRIKLGYTRAMVRAILDGSLTVQEAGRQIFELILATASGEPSKSEKHGFGADEFVPWYIGAVV